MSTTQHNPDQPRYPHVRVELAGEDGNVFTVIGRVAAALRSAVGREAAAEFSAAASSCDSYDAVLRLAMSTVDVR
ncbi:MAG TPA: hypothetical protein VH561_13865 [Micromonosporaceae bacterium]